MFSPELTGQVGRVRPLVGSWKWAVWLDMTGFHFDFSVGYRKVTP